MEPEPRSTTPEEAIVLIISGTCCFPQLAALDQQARQIIDLALKETGIKAQVKLVTASSAVRGGIPFEILQSTGLASNASNIMRLPAILINNQLISYGVPNSALIKNALINAQK